MLAILATHPIQYQVPIWRGLAGHGGLPLKVFYMSDQGLKARFDPGFGDSFAWDIDLLSGYPHEFIDVVEARRQDSFGWLRLKFGFGAMLRGQGVKVLWVQGWQVFAYWQAIREARRAGIQIWLRGDSNLRSNRSRLKQSLKWLVLRQLLNRVDYFLVVGEANRQFYLQLGYQARQLVSAPHCVENERFARQADQARPGRSLTRAQWGIPDDSFCFLFVGKFIAKKRPLDLAEAVRRLQQRQPGQKLHILWVGTGELGNDIREACTIHYCPESGLGAIATASGLPAASFTGFLNQSEIAHAYVAADALVLTSDAKETWGLVVNEAMASGLPCVVSAACGCTEDLVLPLRPDLSFPVGDLEALTNALAAVVADPPSAGLLQSHMHGYDVQRTVDSVTALYHRHH